MQLRTGGDGDQKRLGPEIYIYIHGSWFFAVQGWSNPSLLSSLSWVFLYLQLALHAWCMSGSGRSIIMHAFFQKKNYYACLPNCLLFLYVRASLQFKFCSTWNDRIQSTILLIIVSVNSNSVCDSYFSLLMEIRMFQAYRLHLNTLKERFSCIWKELVSTILGITSNLLYSLIINSYVRFDCRPDTCK